MHQSLIHFLTHFYCAFSSAFAFDAFAFVFDAFATLTFLTFVFADLSSGSALSSGLGSGCSGSGCSGFELCWAFVEVVTFAPVTFAPVTFVTGGKSVQSLLEQDRNVGLQVHHPNALVGPVLVVGVQAHQEQVGHALAVVPLQNGLVRIQLKAVVPVVRVRDVRDEGGVRVVLGAKRHLLDFLAALPVVNAQRAVG